MRKRTPTNLISYIHRKDVVETLESEFADWIIDERNIEGWISCSSSVTDWKQRWKSCNMSHRDWTKKYHRVSYNFLHLYRPSEISLCLNLELFLLYCITCTLSYKFISYCYKMVRGQHITHYSLERIVGPPPFFGLGTGYANVKLYFERA
jgi:hypothetical protein